MQKNLFKIISFILALVCILFFVQKILIPKYDIPKPVLSENVYETSLPDDFHTFYDQYHTDSLFQLARTVFPLNGVAKSSDSTELTEKIRWHKKDWILHKPFDNQNGTFDRVFTNFGGIISEQISANKGLFTLEKRYAKIGGKWHLIYYQELIMNG